MSFSLHSILFNSLHCSGRLGTVQPLSIFPSLFAFHGVIQSLSKCGAGKLGLLKQVRMSSVNPDHMCGCGWVRARDSL